MQSETNDLVLEVHIFESWIAWGVEGMQQWMQNVEAAKKLAFFERWMTVIIMSYDWLLVSTLSLHISFSFFFPSFETLTPDTQLQNVSNFQ